jgi:Kef-type K+ transport system membrane component KefB
MFVMNLFAGVALADVVGLLLIHHVPALRQLEPKSIGWLRIIVQIAFPASLALGAWHRTRWGWRSERLERAVEPKVPLVGRTGADIGFKICVALLLMIVSAALVQFVQAGTDPNMLFR